MKQLLLLSGKGGTGKTTLASAFIRLAQARAWADCDVDAPNLHLVLRPASQPLRKDYYGLPKARIDSESCIACDRCRIHCRFDAIQATPVYTVDPYACEGCAVCELVCPAGAVTMEPAVAGERLLYTEPDLVFSTAQLKMGSGTTGLLVSEVKKQLKEALTDPPPLTIIDGSPGIGCPVIASLSGVDLVLIVAEPSVSGLSDLKRIVETAARSRIPAAVCVNRFDTNPALSRQIEAFAQENKLPFTGRVPFDSGAVEANNRGMTLADVDGPAAMAVRQVFQKTLDLLFGEEAS